MANLLGVPQLDFSALGGLRQQADEQRRREQEAFYRQQAFQQRQAEAAREQAFAKSLSDLPQRDGVYDYGEMATRAARAGYLPGVEHFSRLAEAQRARLEGRSAEHVVTDAAGNQRIISVDRRTKQATDVTPPGLSNAQPTNPYAVGGKRTEHEDKSALFSDRAATAHQAITKFENINQEPGGKIGALVEQTLPAGAANILVSGERGQLMNAKRAFINALLRRESGAAIAATEFASYDKEYFPQLGDTKEQINDKRIHRAEVVAGLAREAGRGYRPGFTIDPETGFITKQSNIPAAAGAQPQTQPQTTGKAPGSFDTANAPPAPPAAQRVKGNIYQTPKGPLMWTGEAWVEP
jgi:hypothetical protein